MRYTNKWVMIAAAIAVAGVGASHVRADQSYGYAEQTVSGLKVLLPTGGLIGGASITGTNTSASAVVNGSGVATNAPFDTLESSLLAALPAPQNDFTKYSSLGGGTQVGSFTRGDSSMSNSANLFGINGITISTVSESVATAANGLETGVSAAQVSGSFQTTATSVTVSYSYANDVLAATVGTGNGPANAQFGVQISVSDQHGHEVDATPSELNTAVASPANGPELLTSGTGNATVSLAALTAGDIYTISIVGQTQTGVGAPLPEPASVGMLVAAFGLIGRRRR